MSFKGFQKSISRAPQQLKVKFNIGEHTKDPVYSDAERRFQELEKETKKLHDESKKYFEAINGETEVSEHPQRAAQEGKRLLTAPRHVEPPDRILQGSR
jgi:hypothetical protein